MRSRRLRDKRRHAWRGSIISSSDAKKISATQVRNADDIVLCIQTSVVDSVAFHLHLSKIEAMARILEDFNKIKEKRGEYQLKVTKTPIVIHVKFQKQESKICAEIQLSTKNIIMSVDKLSSLVADEALKREMNSL